MKLKWNGIEWENGRYLYWFDRADVPENRMIGIHFFDSHRWICFWYFNIGWNLEICDE